MTEDWIAFGTPGGWPEYRRMPLGPRLAYVAVFRKNRLDAIQPILEGQHDPIPDPTTRPGRLIRQRHLDGPFLCDEDMRAYVLLLTLEDPRLANEPALRWWLP